MAIYPGPTPEGWAEQPPDMNNQWFQTYDKTRLVVGEVFGARSFRVTPEGFLVGKIYEQIWQPGDNLARCMRVTAYEVEGHRLDPNERPYKAWESRPTGQTRTINGREMPIMGNVHVGWAYRWEGQNQIAPLDQPPVPLYENDITDREHSMLRCSCGWHAYLQGSMDYAGGRDTVSGVVAGSGRVVWCDHGFRAEHVQIVALFVPETAGKSRPSYSMSLNMRDALARSTDSSSGLRWDADRDVLELISKNYPDVPIYTDVDEMLAFHPTTPPSEVEPKEGT